MNMRATQSPERKLLDRLIRQQHDMRDGRYALFFVTGEGKYLPASSPEERLEQTSGYVVDSHDHVFAFWLGWDAERGQPALTRWRQVAPPPDWNSDDEYRDARAEVGLAIASPSD
jgi:hypothetical protein